MRSVVKFACVQEFPKTVTHEEGRHGALVWRLFEATGEVATQRDQA